MWNNSDGSFTEYAPRHAEINERLALAILKRAAPRVPGSPALCNSVDWPHRVASWRGRGPPWSGLPSSTTRLQTTLSGGTIGPVFALILANGDDAIQTNYVLDGAVVYRVDAVKNDRRYTLAVSIAEALLTQAVDNALVTIVTALCVD